MNVSNILRTDSYKVSHWKQYPSGTEKIYSYLESRGGQFPATLVFGLTYYLKEYLSKPITMADIDKAEKLITAHMGDVSLFNRAGWERIVKKHRGFMPVRIMAVPEGTLVDTSNVIVTVENTDPELPWVTNYVETILSKLWYTCTVATISFEIKRTVAKYLNLTGDISGLPFKLHDFGYRGVSSEESAQIGGMAHLVNFMGTDTMIALAAASEYYGEDMAGFSIPAAEHSTITSWGKENEEEAFRNMVKQFGNGALYAVVSDSYDIFNACKNLWGDKLKAEVLAAPGTLVVRPDSGDPTDVVLEVVELLGDAFGFTTNSKGFKVLNKVRVIQGDGIDGNTINSILYNLYVHGWSADNVAFGMGGALLQRLDRDTQKFAFKASSIRVNGETRDVWKDPITDSGKVSKRGRLKLVKGASGAFETVPESNTVAGGAALPNELKLVWLNGQMIDPPTFAEIRERANSYL